MVAIDIGIIIGGLVILCFGGYALVLGSVALAKKLQIILRLSITLLILSLIHISEPTRKDAITYAVI